MNTRQRQRTPRTAHTTLRPYPVADMTFNTGGAFCHVATAQGKGRFTARLPPGSNAIPEESNVDKTFVCKPPPRAQPPRPTPRARLPACRQHTHTCLHGLRLLSLATRVSACAADVRNPDGKGIPLLVTHHSSEKVTREVEDGPGLVPDEVGEQPRQIQGEPVRWMRFIRPVEEATANPDAFGGDANPDA